MIGNLAQREDELGGKTLLIVGLGQIGARAARQGAGAGHADEVLAMYLNALLPQADFIALTCPLTAETEKLINADALGRMKRPRIFSTRRAGAWSTSRRS
jgi:phosphoglycerate dehydrogenase-like enzyme